MKSKKRFVHLRLHTEFSIVDGLIRIPLLMKRLQDMNMNSVAVTEFCNLFSVIKVYKSAIKNGIKPIFGSDLLYCLSDNLKQISSLVLLCQNEKGYKNLMTLISKSYQNKLFGSKIDLPLIYSSWLRNCSDGLIALSGGRLGCIGKALLLNDEKLALKLAKFFSEIFYNRFYLEIQRTGRLGESEYNKKIICLADKLGLPLVATNDVCFLYQNDFEAHEVRVCINKGYTLSNSDCYKKYSSQQYLRSVEEMVVLFKDLPQAIENTVEISKRCTVMFNTTNKYLPNFFTPNGEKVEDYLFDLSMKGLFNRFKSIIYLRELNISNKLFLKYKERLKNELHIINKMGFASYFLIVADFICWAKKNKISVGPGRGSGAGSLVAYSLNITDIDPIKYKLFFERFLNPERVFMPDFDIDFCILGRDRVIEYVSKKYGKENVSKIITFGTLSAKAVVRDVGRVLGYPYSFVDKIAKLIPYTLGVSLYEALSKNHILMSRYNDEEEVRELIDLSMKLEGIVRNVSKHAGGVVISPSKLTNFTAIYCEKDSLQFMSQLDKSDLEYIGLIKFDFLGLKTLTIIDWAISFINKEKERSNKEYVNISLLPLNDEKTFSLLQSCNTIGIFQLESYGMRKLIKKIKPNCFKDIISLIALYRPGPLQSNMVENFINCKNKKKEISYLHVSLKEILEETYGVILYQEQVMQVAQVLANYSLGSADILRRAMCKKNKDDMDKQRNIFVKGAQQSNISSKLAINIFNIMEKFAGYGFNKSHSTAYALLTYRTAWIKANYPAFFMTAVMSYDMSNTDKIIIFINECFRMNIKVLPPSINKSQYKFMVIDNNSILYGLGAIKGLGVSIIKFIIEERIKNGEYIDLFNFCYRMDLKKINRRVLEVLIKSGSMDCFMKSRSILYNSLHNILRNVNRIHKDVQYGQINLLNSLEDNYQEDNDYFKLKDSWSDYERLSGEKETLGLYLTDHPTKKYIKEFKKFVFTIFDLTSIKKGLCYSCCGLINNIKSVLTKSEKEIVIISIEDYSAMAEIVVNSIFYQKHQNYLKLGKILLFNGIIVENYYNNFVRMILRKFFYIHKK
ncbi:DNA polymerase III subunit alpha [Candidatus Legionella polyplacis]|uniref:DNA polymerase III subunit alpha n=1 Tax=Candidatus Legionella polyplacis TaxID=2005262 RepID=UPI001314120A|nr:DNA polymerase III subunit alpha [Candidatus Legionella polyplacis]